MYCSQLSIVLIFLLSHTLFPWPPSLLPPLFYWLFLQHNWLKTVILPFSISFFCPSFFFFFFPLWFLPGLLNTPYFSYHFAGQLLLISLSELWKQLFGSWFYLRFPFSMGLEVLIIRIHEMMHETHLSALEKTNVAQMCCRNNLDRSSWSRNYMKKEVACYHGMSY